MKDCPKKYDPFPEKFKTISEEKTVKYFTLSVGAGSNHQRSKIQTQNTKIQTEKSASNKNNTFQASLEADSNANGREFKISSTKIQRKI